MIPALNEAAAIGATLAALGPLRGRGHEVIVVDGGSDDRTRPIAAAFADRVLLSRRGRATQMNAGAAIAAGDVLLFLHADTRLPANADASIARALSRDRHWGRFDVAIEGDSAWLPVVARAMNVRSRITGIATGDQAMFVTRAAFHAAGGYPDLPLMEDVALSKRLRRQPAGRHACATSRARRDADGTSEARCARSRLMWHLRFAFLRGADIGAIAQRYGERRAPALQIFAREPRPGAVKRRLAATIGAARATAVYTMLVERTLAAATAARAAGAVGDVELWCTPTTESPAFHALRDRYGVVLMPQCEGDLGARMHHALRASLARGMPALLVGTDCPGLDDRYLRDAAAALATHDIVIGPAEDGGYVLIGLARDADVFSNVRWSTADVLPTTCARARALGMHVFELPRRFDIDTAQDLTRFERSTAASGGA